MSILQKAYETLRNYCGSNNQILYYKHMVEKDKMLLKEGDFATDYILKNAKYTPFDVNKVVKISDIFGKQLQEKFLLDFIPEKLKIFRIIGEMGNSYHGYAQFRQSVQPQLMYIPQKYILTPLFQTDYNEIEVDFDKYDKLTEKDGRKLREHQKTGAKFLLANKKCILADTMGCGKTSTAIIAALETGCKKILVITTASLKTTWKREIELYEPSDNICVINGSKWDGSTGKFTIINYDIVQNYYEIPMEVEYEEHVIENSNGELETFRVPAMKKDKNGNLVPKMVKSRKKTDIKKALENSPLFLSDFDCVIIDEAQKLCNSTSNRYKVIYDFLNKSQIQFVFLVTGTPLTNTPMNLYNVLRLIKADITNNYEFFITRYCDGKTMYKNGEWKKWSDMYDRNNIRGITRYDYIDSHAQKMTIPQGATNLDELRERIKHLYIRRLSSDIPGMVNKEIQTRYYDLSREQKIQYDKLWDEYLNAQESSGNESNEEYRQLVEGILVRQYLANEMVENTISLANDFIEDGEKIVIVCNFTSEIEKFKKYYGKKCVVYDGKMTLKQKDKAIDQFLNNKSVKVFVGQILAMSVGLSLTSSHILIFNSYSWSENDNRQAQDRIYRITQNKDAICIYQLFTDSISQDMFEKVIRKGLIMDNTIIKEDEK